MKPIDNPAVAQKFASYPTIIQNKLMGLRALILDTAASIKEVGIIEETLKWGEPAYVTSTSKTGSTIRIDWKAAYPDQYAMYFHCQTNLIATFRTIFPETFSYNGNRSIVFNVKDAIPIEPLRFCIASALTYHLKNKSNLKVL